MQCAAIRPVEESWLRRRSSTAIHSSTRWLGTARGFDRTESSTVVYTGADRGVLSGESMFTSSGASSRAMALVELMRSSADHSSRPWGSKTRVARRHRQSASRLSARSRPRRNRRTNSDSKKKRAPRAPHAGYYFILLTFLERLLGLLNARPTSAGSRRRCNHVPSLYARRVLPVQAFGIASPALWSLKPQARTADLRVRLAPHDRCQGAHDEEP